jgi:hypothetical protein
MSGSYWAYRSAAELPDYDPEPPTVQVLWDKRHTARRAHLCSLCGEAIAPGTRYRSIGVIIDGEFLTQKEHGLGWGANAVSPCPKFAARDHQELAAQYEADKALFGGSPEGIAAGSEGEAEAPGGTL